MSASRTFVNGYRERAAIVVLKCSPTTAHELLMVSSNNHPSCYVFPGGGVDPGESIQAAAAREAREEAGVVLTSRAQLEPLCVVISQKKQHRTHVFLLEKCNCELLDQYDDCVLRKRVWVPISQTSAAVGNRPHQLELLNEVLSALRRRSPALAAGTDDGDGWSCALT